MTKLHDAQYHEGALRRSAEIVDDSKIEPGLAKALREAADHIAWGEKVRVARNATLSRLGDCAGVKPGDIAGLLKWAEENRRG